jgi:hypothetical protein
MFCVLATNDEPRPRPDATHDRDHYPSVAASLRTTASHSVTASVTVE